MIRCVPELFRQLARGASTARVVRIGSDRMTRRAERDVEWGGTGEGGDDDDGDGDAATKLGDVDARDDADVEDAVPPLNSRSLAVKATFALAMTCAAIAVGLVSTRVGGVVSASSLVEYSRARDDAESRTSLMGSSSSSSSPSSSLPSPPSPRPPVSPEKQRYELDIVVSVYDEVPQTLLGHLAGCCPKDTCRVWLYSAFDKGGKSVRSHTLQKQTQVALDIDDWMEVSTPFEKHGDRVNNTWTGTESTAYLTHVYERYDDFADNIAFVHGHLTSWHSDTVCSIVREGVKKANIAIQSNAGAVYVNINKPYPMRCLSRKGQSGPYATEELRTKVYRQWSLWTGEATTPERITWECCAQFVTTRDSLRARDKSFWKHAYEAMYSFPQDKIPWEYLWPTLVSPAFSAARGDC